MAFKIESNLLDACALAILKRGDTYGYEITQEMKKGIDISESTLYPVLRRLQKDKLCFTYDQPYQGRNRRYYSISPEGEAKLSEYEEMWEDYRNAIESLLYANKEATGEDNAGEAAEADEGETGADEQADEITVERGDDDE